MDDWKKTGVCPNCKTRAIAAAICKMCGWMPADMLAQKIEEIEKSPYAHHRLEAQELTFLKNRQKEWYL